jgi:hypothetical protein
MDSDDVAVLDAEIVAHNTVDTDASIIQIIVGQNNKHGILSLLSLHEDLFGKYDVSRYPKAGENVGDIQYHPGRAEGFP